MFGNIIDKINKIITNNYSKVPLFYTDNNLKIKYHPSFNEDKELLSYMTSLEILLIENIDKIDKNNLEDNPILFIYLNYESYKKNCHSGYFDCFLNNNIKEGFSESDYELIHEFISCILDYIKFNYDIKSLI